MKSVTIGVSSLEQTKQRVLAAFKGGVQGAFIMFASVELLWKTLTPRRWDIIRTLTGQGQMSLRGIAKLVQKDVKTTHNDVHALLDAGILEKTDEGKIIFPYYAVHVDFTIGKAA